MPSPSSEKAGVELRLGCGVKAIQPGFKLSLPNGEELHSDYILLATEGVALAVWFKLALFNPISSAFSFHLEHTRLTLD